ncbi:SMI1/KNR4 family protein [Paenibacillus silviterrae]|uniref:SMI1/KNR4 family protein n=1 Tax=Paenibacillus silviterrae TaxID=3242194 RepID=UPI0025435032|nr:SMI1/KNR4 family protein [Paenibacillus chinjuensis]
MDFNDFSSVVEEARLKHPVWFGLDSDPTGADDAISKIESRLSVILPEEYKRFVKTYGGGYFAFTNIFSVNEDSEWHITERNIKIGLLYSHNFIAVSDNEVGDFYGFQIENGVCNPSIKFYDHESNQVKKTGYKNLYEYILKVGLKQG